MGNSVVSGIDIGHHNIKVVVLKPYKGRYALVGYQELPIEAGIFSDNHMLNYQKIVKKLKELRKSLPRISRKVALTLPDSSVISKVIQIDSDIKSQEIEFALLESFSSQSPFPLEALCLDFVPLEQQSSDQYKQFQVFATKKEVVHNRIDVMQGAGLSPLLIDLRSYSLARVWQLAACAFDSNDWMLINLECQLATLCIDFPHQAPYCKDITIASCDESLSPECCTRVSAKEFKEKLKRQLQLVTSIYGIEIQGIWLCGKGEQCSILAEWLRFFPNLKCRTLDPFDLLQVSVPRKQSNELSGSSFAIAMGAALRGLGWLGCKNAA
jgi:type IV pilus assembly protein PilM